MGARENSVAVPLTSVTTLTTLGLKNSRGVGQPVRGGGDRAIGAAGQQAGHGVDHLRRDQRLVALDVDHDLRRTQPEQGGGLGQAVGAGRVRGGGEQRFDAERLAGGDDLSLSVATTQRLAPLARARSATHHHGHGRRGPPAVAREARRLQPRRHDDDELNG